MRWQFKKSALYCALFWISRPFLAPPRAGHLPDLPPGDPHRELLQRPHDAGKFFFGGGNDTVRPILIISSKHTSQEMCVESCRADGYKWAGVTYAWYCCCSDLVINLEIKQHVCQKLLCCVFSFFHDSGARSRPPVLLRLRVRLPVRRRLLGVLRGVLQVQPLPGGEGRWAEEQKIIKLFLAIHITKCPPPQMTLAPRWSTPGTTTMAAIRYKGSKWSVLLLAEMLYETCFFRPPTSLLRTVTTQALTTTTTQSPGGLDPPWVCTYLNTSKIIEYKNQKVYHFFVPPVLTIMVHKYVLCLYFPSGLPATTPSSTLSWAATTRRSTRWE